ncbi:MAG: hypothetical protein ACLTW9_11760 [Enterocloster sp.]
MAAALLGAVLIVSMMPVRVLAKDRTGEGWRDKVEITAHRGGQHPGAGEYHAGF